MAPHLDAALSLYLDDLLSPEERASADAHLSGCESCRAELTELREAVRLLAALPERVPSRSLLPRSSRLPAWLVPARWASSAVAAVFALLFVASSLPAGGIPLGGGGAAPAPAAAPRQAPETAAAENQKRTLVSPSPVPAGGSTSAADQASPLPTTAPQPGTDTALRERASAPPRGSFATGYGELATRLPESRVPPPPVIWLAGALAAGALALGLHLRIARQR